MIENIEKGKEVEVMKEDLEEVEAVIVKGNQREVVEVEKGKKEEEVENVGKEEAIEVNVIKKEKLKNEQVKEVKKRELVIGVNGNVKVEEDEVVPERLSKLNEVVQEIGKEKDLEHHLDLS